MHDKARVSIRALQRIIFGAVFGGLLLGGAAVELALKPPLYSNAQAIGMHAIALLIPYVAAIAFVTWTIIAGRSNRTRTIGTSTLFVLLVLPFLDVLAAPIVHLKGDDSYRYSLYARHILSEPTLWGSDQLFHGSQRSRAYLDQPGYRYYLAAAIAVLGGEHRGLQLASMALLLALTISFVNRLMLRGEQRLAAALAIFLLASAPYAAKNVLYGYSEWLAVAVFIGAANAALAQRYVLMLILIALAAFLRQNLLLVSLVVATFTVIRTRRLGLLPLYLLVLALPVYHNLFYARQARFFVEHTGVIAPLTGRIWQDVVIKLGGYLGYMPGEKLSTLFIAVVFAPLGIVMVARAVKGAEGRHRWLLGTTVAAAIVPTLVYGSGSYPRFEYVNLTVILLSFVIFAAVRRPPSPLTYFGEYHRSE